MSLTKNSITIIAPTYYPKIHGLSFVVQQNVSVLLQLGYNVNVLTENGARPVGKENVYSFKVHGNGSFANRISGDIKNYQHFLEKISLDSRFIIVHGWHSWSTNLCLNIRNKLKTKIILYSHGTGFSTLESPLHKIIRSINYFGQRNLINKYLFLIDGIVFLTEEHRHPRCYDLIHYKGTNKYYIPNPINKRPILNYRSEETAYLDDLLNTNCKIAFCLSNYDKVKNQKYLINLTIKYNFSLVCVGAHKTPYYYKLKKVIKKNKLESRVLLLDSCSDATIISIFHRANMFLFASLNDFSPLVILEASYYSLPFLSFKTATSENPGGYYCDSKNDFESKLLKLLNMPSQKLKEIGAKGKKYTSERNSDEAYFNNIKNLVNSIK